MEKVTVLMPVGPNYNPEWLKEAFDSAVNQTHPPDEILIIDDGTNLERLISLDKCPIPILRGAPYLYNYPDFPVQIKWSGNYHTVWYDKGREIRYFLFNLPCNVGFTAAFNMGIALANNDLVVYLSSDDKLMPTAVEEAVNCYLENDKKDAWYAYTYELSTGDICEIPMNYALITKGLWEMVGGFPPAGFVGADALVLSCLLAHAPDRIIKIKAGEPLIWFRDHPNQETKVHTDNFIDEMTSIRNKITRDFKFK